MATLKIKKGDQVKIIAGKDKGKEGKVIEVNKKKNAVLVENVNMSTIHSKASAQNKEGGIEHKEAYIDISNVMYLHKGKPTKIGFKIEKNKKVRFAKSTNDKID